MPAEPCHSRARTSGIRVTDSGGAHPDPDFLLASGKVGATKAIAEPFGRTTYCQSLGVSSGEQCYPRAAHWRREDDRCR